MVSVGSTVRVVCDKNILPIQNTCSYSSNPRSGEHSFKKNRPLCCLSENNLCDNPMFTSPLLGKNRVFLLPQFSKTAYLLETPTEVGTKTPDMDTSAKLCIFKFIRFSKQVNSAMPSSVNSL